MLAQADVAHRATSAAHGGCDRTAVSRRCVVIEWISGGSHASLFAARMDVTPSKVLVLEDDEDVSRAIARKLRGEGYAIEESMEPVPVLRRLEGGEGDWDVVILDMGLPDLPSRTRLN